MVFYKNTPPLPTFNYVPNPPARLTSASDIANQPLSSETPLHEMKHEAPLVPICKPTVLTTPRPTTEVGTPADNILTMVASAMKGISSVQQKLAANQSLPPVQLNKFSGSSEEFPVFK